MRIIGRLIELFALSLFVLLNPVSTPSSQSQDDASNSAIRTITLVAKGQSEFAIQHAGDAPDSAKLAAKELQRGIFTATGVQLRITTDASVGPAIRIVSAPNGAPRLPQDGFEIRVVKRDLVITGNDEDRPAQPDTWFVPSHGTLFGAFDFLERFLGTRWLFPGELGEDLLRRDSLTIDLSEPVIGKPSFAIRQVAYLGESDPGTPGRPKSDVLDWMRRQRLTNSMHPFVASFGHSWDDYITPADMAAHPEWKSTNGEAVRNGKVKFFCTTAPGLVETFAARVIETSDRFPTREMTSISPTDGGGFCDCDRCRKLISVDPHGKKNHALAMLTFYKQIAEIVGRERPHRRLGGFVYYNYQYPPAMAPELPNNLALCWAPLNYYGYGLLKPPYRQEFAGVMKQWCELTPHLVYHNYSTWMRSFHGAPLPISIDILKRELPTAAREHAWGARMVGSTAWGINAPINYVLSKQLWNSELDVSATLDEWLQRAYGPGWRHMRRLYDELDEKMLAHKSAQSPVYKGSQYEVNAEVMQQVYVPLLASFETHFRAALAACETDLQRQRLAMFGDNLVQLHDALRKAKLINENRSSLFFRDDSAFNEFLKSSESTWSLHRDGRGIYRGPIWHGEWNGN